ncbi:hypothetical protein BTVI_150876 [Pitangus sulphuratus]|nr:hypothetical protein BTVI_150876 [Pitangus sulphuratus]
MVLLGLNRLTQAGAVPKRRGVLGSLRSNTCFTLEGRTEQEDSKSKKTLTELLKLNGAEHQWTFCKAQQIGW